MEREIKFRAWDKTGRNMVDWLTIRQTAFNRGEYQMLYKILVDHADNFCIMQFTGLKDDKGLDIYEGDLVDCQGTQYVCRWNPHRCEFAWYVLREDGGYVYSVGDCRSKLLVIGNIYETPERMLQKGQDSLQREFINVPHSD